MLVNIFAQAQKKPEYLEINPRGKVPGLLIDDKLLTENAVILLWLHDTSPEARLLPEANNPLDRYRQISDLVWISSTWHPFVRANMMPKRWITGDPEPVRKKGRELFADCLDQLEARLAEEQWWYGKNWSITDVYFYWFYTTAHAGQFSLDDYPAVLRHLTDIEALPSFQRALERERVSLPNDWNGPPISIC